jgi:hypothetical protein
MDCGGGKTRRSSFSKVRHEKLSPQAASVDVSSTHPVGSKPTFRITLGRFYLLTGRKNMVRLMCLTLAIAVAIGISAAAAQTGGGLSSKVQSMTGVVKTVSASSLILERGGNESIFAVDSATRVLARGATRDLVDRKRVPRLTDFVKAGDRVMVRYRLWGSAMNAVEVRVLQR